MKNQKLLLMLPSRIRRKQINTTEVNIKINNQKTTAKPRNVSILKKLACRKGLLEETKMFCK